MLITQGKKSDNRNSYNTENLGPGSEKCASKKSQI